MTFRLACVKHIGLSFSKLEMSQEKALSIVEGGEWGAAHLLSLSNLLGQSLSIFLAAISNVCHHTPVVVYGKSFLIRVPLFPLVEDRTPLFLSWGIPTPAEKGLVGLQALISSPRFPKAIRQAK